MNPLKRSSGIFLHPTSLPSRYGIGDLGQNACHWIDVLARRKQTVWQVCPLVPTGYGDSPYQSLSSFAGNSLLISPDRLYETGLLTKEDIDAYPQLPAHHTDYGAVITNKLLLFDKAIHRFVDDNDFLAFCEREKYWLDDYAIYRLIKDAQGGNPWNQWPAALKLRFPAALAEIRAKERKKFRNYQVRQYLFHRQWAELKAYANAQGVKIVGDIPYCVSYDSADAWSMPDLFEFDENGLPLRVAGVPPDYFSKTGQRWGNPIYRWDYIRENGYRWWIDRIRKLLTQFDYVRLDHFRGFESFWAIPADCPTAIEGEWAPGPGIAFFNALKSALGTLPIIAEDLGDITPKVEELRRRAGFPGIKVLQFAFDGNDDNPYLPYNISPDSVMYTGTHDNDTSLGWFLNLDQKQRIRVCDFLGCSEYGFMESFIRSVFAAPSYLCIVPFQDVLGLGSEHRLNTPGQESGNWQWRFSMEMVTEDRLRMIEDFTRIYGREPLRRETA
jgi:4-alpha-glucanotransferase